MKWKVWNRRPWTSATMLLKYRNTAPNTRSTCPTAPLSYCGNVSDNSRISNKNDRWIIDGKSQKFRLKMPWKNNLLPPPKTNRNFSTGHTLFHTLHPRSINNNPPSKIHDIFLIINNSRKLFHHFHRQAKSKSNIYIIKEYLSKIISLNTTPWKECGG